MSNLFIKYDEDIVGCTGLDKQVEGQIRDAVDDREPGTRCFGKSFGITCTP